MLAPCPRTSQTKGGQDTRTVIPRTEPACGRLPRLRTQPPVPATESAATPPPEPLAAPPAVATVAGGGQQCEAIGFGLGSRPLPDGPVLSVRIAAGGLLVAMVRLKGGRQKRLRAVLIVSIMFLLALGEWLVRPMMEAARLPDGTPGEGFAALHGVSAVLYLLASLACVFLVAARIPSVTAAADE